ncbi:MAG TPA: hypothetical protein VFQ67_17680 [Allosphingosinicella sp.]|jgi:hypothetical protein|nr:hypothetical protein [Allosphingosinicella sp.]
MTLSPTKRAGLVSARELPDIVDSAVKTATQRIGSAKVSGPLVRRWDIAGKVLKDLATAQSFSKEVTAEVTRAGVKAKPALLIVDKDILAGFIDRDHIPKLREF